MNEASGAARYEEIKAKHPWPAPDLPKYGVDV